MMPSFAGAETSRKFAGFRLTILSKPAARRLLRAGFHAGTAAREPANSIAHCVLDFEGNEVETREGTPRGRDVDPYSESRFKPVVPWQRQSSAVNIVLVAVAVCCHLPQNPACNAAFQIGPVT